MIKLYSTLPVSLQNLILTCVNTFKYYQKFGALPVIRPLSTVIKNLPIDDLNDLRTLHRINNLIKYATKNVPYYISNKSKYKLLESLSDIKDLPILYKSTLKLHNKEFISNEANDFNSYSFQTSGSTGTPIRGKVKNADLQMRLKIFLKSLKTSGIDYSRPLARFPGADIAGRGPVYRMDFLNKHLLFSIYHLSELKIHEYFDALSKHKIEILEGYPSTIFALVRLLKAKNLKLASVKHILTTAEKLQDYQRIEIEEYFGISIFDFYGSSEGSVYMFSASEGCYINSNKIGYLECVDENYLPVDVGVNGRMLVTSFSTTFTPLIRYDIGDYATIMSVEDEIIKVKHIAGRQEEIFCTPDGRSFGRFSLILKYLPAQIVESQLILTNRKNVVTLQYMSISAIDKEEFLIFETKMNSLLKMKCIFTYERVTNFDKIQRGKLSAVKILK